MEQDVVLSFLNEFGLVFMFVIVTMEYLNLPGFPAGIIFPAVGIWTQYTDNSFVMAFIWSIVAGLLGSMILYIVGRWGGANVLDKICNKHPKLDVKMKKYVEKINSNANFTVFIAKLIPVVRTLIGFPAGAIKMGVGKYLLFSGLGIAIWNGILMVLGVVLGNTMFAI